MLTLISIVVLCAVVVIACLCVIVKPETTDIRVMSFNIQAELWGGPPIEGREEKLNTLLMEYLPDVVGLQEVTAPWYEYLSKYEGEKYCFVDKVNENGDTNYSPLIYNKDTTELLKHGTRIYSRGNDPKLRLLSWGLFKNKETGSKFIVTSTHWDIGSNADMITVQAAEMGKWVKEFHQKYGVPVISTGDYNRKVTTDQFRNFVAISGFIDGNTAKTITEQDKNAETIDHIMASGDVVFNEFKILRDEFATSISDHKPMYADITIWP